MPRRVRIRVVACPGVLVLGLCKALLDVAPACPGEVVLAKVATQAVVGVGRVSPDVQGGIAERAVSNTSIIFSPRHNASALGHQVKMHVRPARGPRTTLASLNSVLLLLLTTNPVPPKAKHRVKDRRLMQWS